MTRRIYDPNDLDSYEDEPDGYVWEPAVKCRVLEEDDDEDDEEAALEVLSRLARKHTR